MKNLMKSVVFAVAMLLAVSVQAENKPENRFNILNTNGTQDIEQVKCKITAKICGKDYEWNTTFSTEKDCNTVQTIVTLTSLFLQNCD
jgi:hypothetical protein